MLTSLGPIEEPMSGVFPVESLAVYDVGVNPPVAVETMGELLERVTPELHGRIVDFVGDFGSATGLDPTDDFLRLLDDSLNRRSGGRT